MSPDDFIEKLELLVNDENRIVTYKILSQELKIHANLAKKYLMDYLNTQKSKGINLEVYYFLAGFVEKDGSKIVNVLIVSENNLERAKSSFNEVTSCHIYSISKGPCKDEFTLYSADVAYTKNREELNKFSAIKHPNIDMRPPVLSKMQVPNTVVQKKMESKPQANGNFFSKVEKDTKMKTEIEVAEKVSPKKNDSPNQAVDSKTKKSTPEEKKKAGTLMSMWQKKEEKPNSLKKENTKQEVKQKEVKNSGKNSIMSMFSRQAVKNAEKPPVVKTPPSNETPKKESPEKVIPKKESPKDVPTNQNKQAKTQKRKISKKSSKSKNDSDSENEFQPKAKKHRRICTFDESDSESEPEEEKERAQRSFFLPEDPVETPLTPMSDDEPIPPTPPVDVKGKARIWKTVEKTFEDEDGFFVTKKEKELVSEDEEDPIGNKAVKKDEEITKKNPLTHKKQSSLMSFFKQK